MNRENIRTILLKTPENQQITCSGWIRTKRDSKEHCFLALNDGSTINNIQIITDKTGNDIQPVLDKISTGASIEVSGRLVKSPGKEQNVEILSDTIKILGEAPSDFPLQKKRHSLEFLREIAHLRPRTNTFAAVARVRNAMSFAVHSFFQENDFLYVNTPVITASDCEGAGEMFQVTTLDLEKVKGKADYSRDFFGKQASLTVSGQLNAETYACALSNVYTFGPTFRAENSNTTRHLAEFWMIEPEMAFCTLEGNMELAEEFLKYVLNYVLEKCPDDMAFFNQWIQKGIIDDLKKVIDSKFKHITYTQAIEDLEKAGKKFEFKPEWGIDLQTEHERFLTEDLYKGPVIVTDYPRDIKAFYMKQNDDGKTVRAMDILVPRLGEIIGGSERESRYDHLVTRLKEMDLHEKDYEWYLDLRKYGTVPHSGFGLGFERLIQYVTGMQNIRDVIPYPRSAKNCRF